MKPLSRRKFVLGAIAVTGVSQMGAVAREEPPVLGHGTHRYHLVAGGPPLADIDARRWALSGAAAAATRAGQAPVWVAAAPDACELRRFGAGGKLHGRVSLPGGRCQILCICGGYTYVAHENGFISVLDPANRVVSNPGGRAPAYFADGKLKRMAPAAPLYSELRGMAVADNGDIYLSTRNSGKLLRRIHG